MGRRKQRTYSERVVSLYSFRTTAQVFQLAISVGNLFIYAFGTSTYASILVDSQKHLVALRQKIILLQAFF